jgi:hypothetical protein
MVSAFGCGRLGYGENQSAPGIDAAPACTVTGIELCGDGLDNDCDGTIDNDCPCISGDVQLTGAFGGTAIEVAYGVEDIAVVSDGSEGVQFSATTHQGVSLGAAKTLDPLGRAPKVVWNGVDYSIVWLDENSHVRHQRADNAPLPNVSVLVASPVAEVGIAVFGELLYLATTGPDGLSIIAYDLVGNRVKGPMVLDAEPTSDARLAFDADEGGVAWTNSVGALAFQIFSPELDGVGEITRLTVGDVFKFDLVADTRFGIAYGHSAADQHIFLADLDGVTTKIYDVSKVSSSELPSLAPTGTGRYAVAFTFSKGGNYDVLLSRYDGGDRPNPAVQLTTKMFQNYENALDSRQTAGGWELAVAWLYTASGEGDDGAYLSIVCPPEP